MIVARVASLFLCALLGSAQPAPSDFFVCARRVWTMAGEPVSPGCVHVHNGKIDDIVKAAPHTAVHVFNYTEADLTPGLIDIHTHMTLRGDPARSGEQNERSDDVMPQLDILDSLDPWDPAVRHAVSGGVTTALFTPGSIDIVSGRSALLKLHGPPLSNMVLRAPAGVKATSWRKETYEKMDRWFTEAQQAITAGAAPSRPGLKTGMALLKREIPLIVHGGYPSGEIEPVLALADKYHLWLIIYHCETCNENFEEIVARKIPIVVGPRILYWHNGHDTNLPLLFFRLGLKIALTCDAGNAEQKYLLDQAGIAIHYGLPLDQALRAITINPAQIIGIDNRIGSLEKGKDADIVVFSGPVFASTSRVLRVFIDGKSEFEAPR